MKSNLFSCLVAMGIAVAVSSSAQTQTASSEVWNVTIDLYSGMPNPSFTLTAAEVTEVRARLRSAVQIRPMKGMKETILPARLGYRGMIISAVSGKQSIEDSEISDGVILRRSNGFVYDGKAAGLEGYLLGLAATKGLLSPDGVSRIKSRARGSIQ